MNAVVTNSLISYTVLNDFIKTSVSPTEKAILALTFIGALVGVLGVFWTLLIPAAVVEEVAAEADAIAVEAGEVAAEAEVAAESAEGAVGEVVSEAEGLAAQAVGRLAEGIASPKAVPGQGAAVYGSIPGALITGSASSWSKIVANSA